MVACKDYCRSYNCRSYICVKKKQQKNSEPSLCKPKDAWGKIHRTDGLIRVKLLTDALVAGLYLGAGASKPSKSHATVYARNPFLLDHQLICL